MLNSPNISVDYRRISGDHQEVRVICKHGGPDNPEIIFEFTPEGVILKAFNPLEHDPSATELTGWSGIELKKEL